MTATSKTNMAPPLAAWLGGPESVPVQRISAGLALSVLSGFLAVFALEDFGIGMLIWVAFVPAIVAQQRVLPPRWSGLSLAIAIGIMFQGYMGPGLYSSVLPWYLYIYGFWIGLVVLLFTFRSRRFQVRTGYRWFLLAAPAGWVAIDFIRTTLTEVFGGTWGMVAYALYKWPAILQPVSVFGIHGTNLLILMVNWAIAFAVLISLERRLGPVDGNEPLAPNRFRPALAAAVVTVAAWMLASAAMMGSPEPQVTVAAIQPGAYAAEGWRRVSVLSPEQELERSIEQTRAAAAEGAGLIVWREVGVTFDPSGPQGDIFKDLARETGAHLIIGWQAPAEGGRYNEAAAFGPAGEYLGSYGKSHPGTFAGDFSVRQGEYIVYDAAFGRYGTIICFDLDFTDSAREVARLGANLIAVPSSDYPGIAHKHYSHLVFRAIETRLPMVKADSAFDSAIIDPYGRIVDVFVSKSGGRATIVAEVPLGTGSTVYVRWGEWFAWLNVAAAGAFIILGLIAKRRPRS